MIADSRIQYSSVIAIPMIAFALAAGWLIAHVTAHGGLARLCLLLLSVVLTARIWSLVSLRSVRSRQLLEPVRVFPGEPVRLTLQVDNAKVLPVWLRAHVPAGAALGSAPDQHGGFAAYERRTFAFQFTAVRRGVAELGPVQLEAADPLGFYPRARFLPSASVLVYPRLIPLVPVQLPRRDMLGENAGRAMLEDPVQLEGVRDYRAGTAARRIHWKASARRDRLVEKMCEATTRENVLLVVCAEGFEAEEHRERLERCLEVVASLAVRLDAQRCSVRLITNARLAPARVPEAQAGIARVLELLARVEARREADVLDRLRSSNLVSPGISIVSFSRTLHADAAALLAYLEPRRVPLLRVVCDLKGSGPHDVYRLDDLCAEPQA